ncbi:hypothetical protein C922_05490 [Plasmodium inui San Antonio 1]|uniref:Uncharacterized protein n=1 Tax=Plasmodium inui San Antonio 1 TaxID=1237626 RepID=W7AFR0_9APIC|nr:hypothetical protein C922_05490 [Plasmodium inui San Antonio 1]EUD64131.1 hypothetical protein C922_05490 [Plasmodium inui San Antonio 1]
MNNNKGRECVQQLGTAGNMPLEYQNAIEQGTTTMGKRSDIEGGSKVNQGHRVAAVEFSVRTTGKSMHNRK